MEDMCYRFTVGPQTDVEICVQGAPLTPAHVQRLIAYLALLSESLTTATAPQAPAPITDTGHTEGFPQGSPVPPVHSTHYRQPETRPTFDTARYFVGALCPQRHQYQDSTGSLRYVSGEQVCVTCRRERNQRYNARKRERQAWQQTTPQRR